MEVIIPTNISSNLTLLLVGGLGTLIGIIISHFLEKRRSINELLFSARREIYTEFIREHGMSFGPEKIEFSDFDKIKAVETEYERHQRINRFFAQARLVSSPVLEFKLRELYDLVVADLQNPDFYKKVEKKERCKRDYIGYEIEALMRHDLAVIGIIEVSLWRLFSFFKRLALKK